MKKKKKITNKERLRRIIQSQRATDVYEVDDGYVGIGGILKFRSPIKFLDFKVHCIAEEYKASQAIVYTPKN